MTDLTTRLRERMERLRAYLNFPGDFDDLGVAVTSDLPAFLADVEELLRRVEQEPTDAE